MTTSFFSVGVWSSPSSSSLQEPLEVSSRSFSISATSRGWRRMPSFTSLSALRAKKRTLIEGLVVARLRTGSRSMISASEISLSRKMLMAPYVAMSSSGLSMSTMMRLIWVRIIWSAP